jgi:hypothetical protein
MKTRILIPLCLLTISIVFIKCNIKSSKKDSIEPSKEIQEAVDYEATYNSLISEYKPKTTLEKEFKNFKNKSNYIDVIEVYDLINPPELLGGKDNADNISYYSLPTEINTEEYGNNGFVYGDLNGDNKRDCIISVFRSDGYNEVTFFYVFINYGDTFKLENVTNEDAICGCIKEGWPHRFRYQKIEDGYLKGVSECHYKDAHCCPSLYFRTKVKFTQGKLQFHSAEFVMDDAIQYRSTPKVDLVIFENKKTPPY